MEVLLTDNVSKPNNLKHIYVDVLCVESALKIVNSGYKNISHIHYCQKSGAGLGRVVKWFLKVKTGASIVQLNDIFLVEIFKDDINAYERIQNKTRDILNGISDAWIDKTFIQEEVCKNKLNKYKLRSYFEQKAYPYLYRSIELLSIAESDESSKYIAFMAKNHLAAHIEKKYK